MTAIEDLGPRRAPAQSLGSALNHLIHDLEEYNERFTLGSMLFATFMRHVKIEGGAAETDPLTQTEEQEVGHGRLENRHRATLDAIGLALEPVHGRSFMLVGGGQPPAESVEMRLNVADRENLLAFLGGVSKEQVAGKLLARSLGTVAGILTSQLAESYDLADPQAEALQLFGGMTAIIEQYRRLDLAPAVERLDTYLARAREGNLREFVAIERSNLMTKHGEGFGPADWQKDATEKFLERRWDEALATLEAVSKNPKAADLANRLRAHLAECAGLALRDLELIPRLAPQAEAFRGILDEAKRRLTP